MRLSKFFLVVLTLHLLGTALIFSSLPLEIPLLWSLTGDPDAFVPRPAIWFVAVLPIFAYFFMGLQPKVDSRSEYFETQENLYLWGARSFLTLYLYLYWSALIFALGVSPIVAVIIKSVLGMIFIIIGSFLYRTPFRSRWFWAIKTPWTVADEKNWKRMHRIGGWLLVIFGLCMLLLIFAPRGLDIWVFLFLMMGYIATYIWLSYHYRDS